MDRTYREYLERRMQEAQEQFENAKKEVIRDIESITSFDASLYGAAYYAKIDHITQAGQKIESIAEAIRSYNYFNSIGG